MDAAQDWRPVESGWDTEGRGGGEGGGICGALCGVNFCGVVCGVAGDPDPEKEMGGAEEEEEAQVFLTSCLTRKAARNGGCACADKKIPLVEHG